MVDRPRSALVVAGVCGQLGAALGGALPEAVLPVTLLLYVAGVLHARTAAEGRVRVLRWIGTGGLAVLVLLAVPRLAHSGDLTALRGTLGALLVGAQVLQGLSVRTRRDEAGALLTTLGVLVLAASYAPDLVSGLPLVVGWVAVLVALGQLHGLRAQSLVAPVTAALGLGFVVFLLVPTPPLRAHQLGGSGGTSTATRSGSGGRVYSGRSLDLDRRGNLDPTPLARVSKDSPTLWRSTTYATYDGRTWTRPRNTVLPGSGPTWHLTGTPGATRTDQVQVLGDLSGQVFSPGAVDAVSATQSRKARTDPSGDVVLDPQPPSYTVTSTRPVTDPALLHSTTGVDEPDPTWRDLPADLPARVGELARTITRGAPDRWTMAQAINAWLESHDTYRLDSPVPRPGQDAVDAFLFVDKTGFCEQFASAETVLLRSLGVPARFVTGLAYGHPDGGQRLYLGSDLHAWVELWVPGTGWVTSDPTSGAAQAGPPAVTTTPRQQVAQRVQRAVTRLQHLPGGRWTLALLVLAVTGLGVAAARLVFRRRPRQTGGSPALQAFWRLQVRLGSQGLRPGESLRDLRRRVPPDVAEALEVVEQELYGTDPPDTREAERVLDAYLT